MSQISGSEIPPEDKVDLGEYVNGIGDIEQLRKEHKEALEKVQ